MSRESLYPVLCCLVMALAATPGGAAVFTVPPGASIQGAIDAALAAGGNNEVRVAAGTYFELLAIPDVSIATLHVSGGWSTDFAAQPEGLETRVEAAGTGKPLQVACGAGAITVSRLTLTGGRDDAAFPRGGGVDAIVHGDCRLVLHRLWITGNVVERLIVEEPLYAAAHGAGLAATVSGRGRLELRESEISGNAANNRTPGAAAGGGMILFVLEDASAAVTGNTIAENSVAADDNANSGGLRVELNGSAALELTDNLVHSNLLTRAAETTVSGALVASGTGAGCTGCRAELRRNQFLDNSGVTPHSPQFLARFDVDSALLMSDSIIAGGDAGGAFFEAVGGGSILLTNLTIADHDGPGLQLSRDALSQLRLSNSIVFGNGDDSVHDSAPLDPGSNLLGVDPLFVDASARDYRLRLSSPGVDAGNDAPLGGLGLLDVARRPRVQGANVDLGAHETARGPAGGGASVSGCRATELGGSLIPVPAGTRACDCFSEPLVRAHRCSFLLRDSFVWVRIPVPAPFSEFEGDWNLVPWRAGDGSYTLSAEVLVKSEWHPLPLGRNGKIADSGKLMEGKVENGRFLGNVFAAPIDLRLLLSVETPSEAPQLWELELLLPVADGEP